MAAEERGRGAGTLEEETKMKKARGGKIADVDKSAISISTGILGHADHSDRFEVEGKLGNKKVVRPGRPWCSSVRKAIDVGRRTVLLRSPSAA